MDSTRQHSLLSRAKTKADEYHKKIPWIRVLPGSAVAIIILLLVVQIVVWVIVGIVLSFHTSLVATAVLAWTLGLRHALDADHISAIDLMTRRLVASGQKPVTVGTWFSLGHSTIVVVTSIVVAASSAAIQKRFGTISGIGSIIGSSVSAAFLILLGIINAWILYKLYSELQRIIASPASEELGQMKFEGRGCMSILLRKTFKIVDRPWKMYPIGVLFGMGFDTSSEIALLGISSIEAAQGTSFWLILIFPVLFTAGMCLLDTFDGAAMMSLYTSTRLAHDIIAILYYQCVLTAVTVLVALIIGLLQLFNMILNIDPNLDGPFWRGVGIAGDNYEIIGGGICGSFIVLGILSVVCYKPWRRRIDRKRAALGVGVPDDNVTHGEPELLDMPVEGAEEAHETERPKEDILISTRPTTNGESSTTRID